MANDTGTPAGKVSLFLEIKANIEEQISSIADRATASAKEKFAQVGETAGKNFEKRFNASIEKKNAAIKSLERQRQSLQDKLNSIEAEKIRDYKDFFPDKDSLNETVGKLVDNDKVYQKTLEQAEKMDEKIRLSKEKLSYDLQAYDEKMALSAQRAAEKQARAQARAAEKARKAEERAQLAAEKTREKQLKKATKGFRTLGRNIRRSFKQVFLMTAVYAAFKTLRTLLSSATQDSKKFTDSLNTVKANLLGAFAPIISAIMPMLERLMAGLAAVTTRITSFIAGLFGKTYRQVMSKTKKLQGAASGTKGGSLASFDEINQLSSSDSGTGGIDFSAIDTKGDETASKLGEKFRRAFEKINEFLTPVKLSMAGMFENALWAFQSFASSVSPGLMALWETIFLPVITWIRDTTAQAFDFMSEKFRQMAVFFTERSEVITKAFRNIGIMLNTVWTDIIRPVLDNVKKYFGEVISWLLTAFGGFIDFMLGVFTGDWKRMAQGLANIFVGMANAVISAIEMLINTAIDSINAIIARVKSTGLGELVSEITGLSEISHVTFKRFEPVAFANGGIINQPTLGLMGEYAGAYSNPEIVAPQSLMLETFMMAIEPLIASIRQLIENGTGGQEIHIHLDASLSAFARLFTPYLDDEARRKGVKLIVET